MRRGDHRDLRPVPHVHPEGHDPHPGLDHQLRLRQRDVTVDLDHAVREEIGDFPGVRAVESPVEHLRPGGIEGVRHVGSTAGVVDVVDRAGDRLLVAERAEVELDHGCGTVLHDADADVARFNVHFPDQGLGIHLDTSEPFGSYGIGRVKDHNDVSRTSTS